MTRALALALALAVAAASAAFGMAGTARADDATLSMGPGGGSASAASSSAPAAGERRAPWLYGGLGLFAPTLGRLTAQPTGQTSLVVALLPDLAFSGRLGIGDSAWSYSPLIAYTPFGRKSADDGEKVTYLDLAFGRFARQLGQASILGGSAPSSRASRAEAAPRP